MDNPTGDKRTLRGQKIKSCLESLKSHVGFKISETQRINFFPLVAILVKFSFVTQ